MEARVVPQYGFPFHSIWISGLKRTFSMATALLPFKVAVSLVQSARLIRRYRPDVVVGTGGYVSAPVVYAAARMGTRTLIHEQNQYPGIATRKLATRVDEVHVTFASTVEHLPKACPVTVSGNPVRLTLQRHDQGEARKQFGLDPQCETVFIFGGSLGASSINRTVLDILPKFKSENVQLIWQTGTGDFSAASSAARDYRSRVVVREFIHEMDMAYSASTLVVCRAGATSLAEVTALGLPAVLVPFPHAAADHQTKNAQEMESLGAAIVVKDDELSRLGGVLFGLLRDKDALASLARESKHSGRPDAAMDIARSVLRLATGGVK
jgi:UDP-N-acetylglucosamine--N-acetylmuramyl-(pentapeptide) pyrophosphoryl-undecaprenol N-acetylglucosamine transferase